MSKSIRNRHIKNGVIIKIGGDSDKKDKTIANKKFRRASNIDAHLSAINEEDMFRYNDLKDISNTYDFSSDGLAYYVDFNKCRRYSKEPFSAIEKIKYRSK